MWWKQFWRRAPRAAAIGAPTVLLGVAGLLTVETIASLQQQERLAWMVPLISDNRYLWVRILLVFAAIVWKTSFDVINLDQPLYRLRDFRKHYLESDIKPRWEELDNNSGDVRLNIMPLKRVWWTLWLLKRFEMAYPLGFNTPQKHHDIALKLWWFQGLAGEAVRAGEPLQDKLLGGVSAVRPNRILFWKNPYRLTAGQLKKTQHVKWVLSVPMFVFPEVGAADKARIVGVINVDYTGDALDDWLETHSVEEIAEVFGKVGAIASRLW